MARVPGIREKNVTPTTSRRRFLRILALASTGGLMAACSPAATSSPTAPPVAKSVASTAVPPPAANALSTGAATGVSNAPAVGLAPTWQGKTMTIVVAANPGSGHDIWARMYQRHLSRHLPGAPTIIAVNMPGGFSMIGTNFIYSQKPDGLTIGLTDRSIAMKQVLKDEGVRYDVNELGLLGSPTKSQNAMVVHSRTGIRIAEDLKTKNLHIGVLEAKDNWHGYAVVLREILGWQLRISYGFKDSPGLRLAVERGDVDALISDGDTIVSALSDELRSGKLIPVMRSAEDLNHPLLVSAPTTRQLFNAASATDKELVTLVERPNDMGRLFVTPPGLARRYCKH